MNFSKWLTVGIEVALFIMGMTCFHSLHEPGALALTGLGMGAIALGYAVCCYG